MVQNIGNLSPLEPPRWHSIRWGFRIVLGSVWIIKLVCSVRRLALYPIPIWVVVYGLVVVFYPFKVLSFPFSFSLCTLSVCWIACLLYLSTRCLGFVRRSFSWNLIHFIPSRLTLCRQISQGCITTWAILVKFVTFGIGVGKRFEQTTKVHTLAMANLVRLLRGQLPKVATGGL